jgi:VWFA-related protein
MSIEIRTLRKARLPQIVAGLLAFGVTFAGIGQTGQASPRPAGPNAVSKVQPQTNGKPEYVVVTDSKGKPVHGLKQSDFTVLEDGQKMTPQSFEEHRSEPLSPSAPVQPKMDLGPNVFTNLTVMPQNGPLNVLVLDALNTPVANQTDVQRQMLEFVKTMPAGSRLAIFGLSTRLFMLQGFTSDSELLKAALTGKKNLPKKSPLLATPQDAQDQQDQLDSIAAMGDGTEIQRLQGLVEQFQTLLNSQQTSQRVAYTLAALDSLGRYLAGMPGRKNLIWFSGSFPLNILPDPEQAIRGVNPFPSMRDYEDDVRATTSLLSRAQVAVYPIDARGVLNSPTISADNRTIGNPGTRGVQGANKQFVNQTVAEDSAMDVLAEQTGGKAFRNSNDLVGQVEEAIDNGSNYYTIAYAPVDRSSSSAYRKIHVDVDQPGLHLTYRPGYYMDSSGKSATPQGFAAPQGQAQNGAQATRPSAMRAAMVRGSATPTQIIFKTQVVPSAGTEDTLPPGNKPITAMMKPPYRHYTVYYLADISNIAFATAADGSRRGNIEFAAVAFNADGDVINAQTSPLHANIPAADFQTILKSGMQVNLNIDVPAKGEYYLRLGIHDFTSDHVGALEIPLSTLQPEAPPANTGK